MIYKNKLELTARYYGKHAITAVYHGSKLAWEAISSCFGSGYWQQNLPWTDKQGWIG